MTFTVAISASAIIAVLSAVAYISRIMGRFEEFKLNTERTVLNNSKHIDQRFDSLERQMQELRKEILHIRS
jgi:hypothetical protein